MLHEILLSLSGHPSSLFDAEKPDSGSPITPASFPLLSPPEAELLSNVARLAQLHRAIRSHAQTVSSSHPSTICRAVATAITSSHLAKFQQKILDVEARILKQDASIVGAYNIVPLAGVVAEFDEWTRRMEWYWEMACFMLPKESASKSKSKDSGACTGAGLIDRLRQEVQTGYPDVEAAALDLSKVAETAWLRQLSAWVLYGRLPTHGMKDFFIAQIKGEDSIVDYISDSKLLPKFVSARTASSILFIGRSLDQIRNRGAVGVSPMAPKTSELELLPTHLGYLSSLQQNLDLERDEGVVDALANYEQEEKDVLLELDRARKRVDSDLRSLVGRLRELDKERVGTGLFGDGETIGGFEPWKGGGVDRLLMKLDFGASANEDVDDEMFDLV
ncbi:Spc97/Spc98 family protein [Neofusicoccum parvum]|uniref:Spc97/Spc98 family protein n=1 Tax=Neofusicoccum parvum TaxID=310453 RepID=A0ACB5RN88_9PEZI|nr:Spc97/Spc98 family protein [Neofusicoccum parvum]